MKYLLTYILSTMKDEIFGYTLCFKGCDINC